MIYKKLSRKGLFVQKVGLYVGRFQPFHLGHLEAVKYALSKVKELIIAIGSAQYSHTLSDPFTAGERVTMIRLALNEAKIDPSRYYLIPISDVDVHKIWVAHLASYVPSFDVVFSNEPLTSRLFREAGYKVERIPYFNREKYSATEIRKRILTGNDWASLVPKKVAEFIASIQGLERIKELAQIDKPSG
jgi:nicotinamide-nucleotide adenylyltransferase